MMNMKDTRIATTVEQSERLIAFDIPSGTADMHWHVAADGEERLCTGRGDILSEDSSTVRHVPAWSIEALMRIIPMYIRHNALNGMVKTFSYYIYRTEDGEYGIMWKTFSIYPKGHPLYPAPRIEELFDDDGRPLVHHADSLIGACMKAIDWLYIHAYELCTGEDEYDGQ